MNPKKKSKELNDLKNALSRIKKNIKREPERKIQT